MSSIVFLCTFAFLLCLSCLEYCLYFLSLYHFLLLSFLHTLIQEFLRTYPHVSKSMSRNVTVKGFLVSKSVY